MRKTVFALMVLLLVLSACNAPEKDGAQAAAPEAPVTKNTQPVDYKTTMEKEPMTDRAAIEAVFKVLEEEYFSYLAMEDEPMFEYVNNRDEYMNQLFGTLQNAALGPHVSEQFVAQLRADMENCSYDKNVFSTIRQCAEPIFSCSEPMEKVEVIAVDAEGDEAVAMVRLALPLLDKQGCKVSFLLMKEGGTWIIQSRDLIGRSPKVTMVPLQGEHYGSFFHPTQPNVSYRVKDKDCRARLWKCMDEDCEEGGKINGTRVSGDQAELIIDGISGEMVPRWSIKGTTMYVHDYDAVNDTWEDLEYEKEDAAG